MVTARHQEWALGCLNGPGDAEKLNQSEPREGKGLASRTDVPHDLIRTIFTQVYTWTAPLLTLLRLRIQEHRYKYAPAAPKYDFLLAPSWEWPYCEHYDMRWAGLTHGPGPSFHSGQRREVHGAWKLCPNSDGLGLRTKLETQKASWGKSLCTRGIIEGSACLQSPCLRPCITKFQGQGTGIRSMSHPFSSPAHERRQHSNPGKSLEPPNRPNDGSVRQSGRA